MIRETLTTQEKEALEALIDRTSLHAVTDALSEIADEKANHLRHNWQDLQAARVWERCADRLMRAAATIREKGI